MHKKIFFKIGSADLETFWENILKSIVFMYLSEQNLFIYVVYVHIISFLVIETVEERVKTACQGLKNVKNSREQAIVAKSISGEIHEVSPRLMTHPTLAFVIRHSSLLTLYNQRNELGL